MNVVEYVKNGAVIMTQFNSPWIPRKGEGVEILGSDGILYRFVVTDVSYSITNKAGMTVRVYL